MKAQSGDERRRRLPVALGMFAVLAIVAWNTLTAKIPGVQPVAGIEVQVRHLVVLMLGGLAFLTWSHRARPEE